MTKPEHIFNKTDMAFTTVIGQVEVSYSDVIDAMNEYAQQQCILFADWIVNQKWDKVMVQSYKDDGTLMLKTTTELYKIWEDENKA